MKNMPDLRIVMLVILLLPITINVSGQNDEGEPYFATSVNFDLNVIYGSDGSDWTSQIEIDGDGNIILALTVEYPIFENNIPGPKSFYPGPYYDRDPEFQEFPITEDAYDKSYNFGGDIILAKFTPKGDLIYSTYFGGSSSDRVVGMGIVNHNEIIISGYTTSKDFPIVDPGPGGIWPEDDVLQGFVTKFNSSGYPIKSKYFGGEWSDQIKTMKLDGHGNVYLGGFTKSTDFPLIDAAYNNVEDIGKFRPISFVAKLNAELDIQYSSLLGGSSIDDDYSLAISQDGELIVTGVTKSLDFPTTPNAPDRIHNGLLDAFYTKFSSTGEVLISTFIGGALTDLITDASLDSNGSLIMTGYSNSEDYPVDNGEDRTLNDGFGKSSDAIVTKLDQEGQIIWSTFIGGKFGDIGKHVMIDELDHVIIVGETKSPNFPVYGVEQKRKINNGQVSETGDPLSDGFVTKLVPDGRLAFSVAIGGAGADSIADADLISETSLLFAGYTLNPKSYPNTNDNPNTALTDTFFGLMDIPIVELPPREGYIGYNGNLDDIANPDNSTALFYKDPISIAILVGVGLIVLGNILRQSGVLDRFIKPKTNVKQEEIAKYYEKIREI